MNWLSFILIFGFMLSAYAAAFVWAAVHLTRIREEELNQFNQKELT